MRMVSWVSVLALAAAASMDCIVIGLNYGVKDVRIGAVSNAFISLLCFAGTLVSMLVGRTVGYLLNPDFGVWAGGLLFLLVGLWMLRGALYPGREEVRRHYSENPEIVDKDCSKVIELRESVLIGLLLCVNNIGIGVGGGMAGIPLFATPLACAVCSFAFIGLGCSVGRRIGNRRIGKAMEVMSAALILLLGAGELAPLIV